MISISTLAQQLDAQLIGDAQLSIHQFCEPEHPTPGGIVLLQDASQLASLSGSDISAIVIEQGSHELTTDKTLLIVKSCQTAFIQLLEMFAPKHQVMAATHKSVVIGEHCHIDEHVMLQANVVIGSGVTIAKGVTIRANSVIGNNVSIGENCVIYPNVTVYDNCQLGNNVILHAGVVIGCDGFGYQFDGKQHLKRHHLGRVIIEDNVEIGANTTIDRATLGDTVIGAGSKLDNLVQVAHNVKLGSNNILCAYTGVAGSCTTGNNVIMAADVGVADHVTIEDNVILGARTGIPPKKRLSSGTRWLGNPGRPEKKAIEQVIYAQRLPALAEQVKKLKAKIKEMESKLAE
jgi:UDP-3-O-[3-hydroxymyristoyl] glucosamine N-acyltransferase